MRAGKVISGQDIVLSGIRKQKVKLVLVASDASENTKKMMIDKCSYYHVQYIDTLTSQEISQAIGRKRMICGICDNGFAKGMITKMQE